MSFKRTLYTLLATVVIGSFSGCQSIELLKPIEQEILESRKVDIDKDGELEKVSLARVYNPKIKKYGYELRIEETDKKLEVVRKYKENPSTQNYLIFFYHDISKVIEGSVK